MASLVRLLHGVQVVLALVHFAISVFQEVSVNSFPVTSFLMAIQAVTGFPVLVREFSVIFMRCSNQPQMFDPSASQRFK